MALGIRQVDNDLDAIVREKPLERRVARDLVELGEAGRPLRVAIHHPDQLQPGVILQGPGIEGGDEAASDEGDVHAWKVRRGDRSGLLGRGSSEGKVIPIWRRIASIVRRIEIDSSSGMTSLSRRPSRRRRHDFRRLIVVAIAGKGPGDRAALRAEQRPDQVIEAAVHRADDRGPLESRHRASLGPRLRSPCWRVEGDEGSPMRAIDRALDLESAAASEDCRVVGGLAPHGCRQSRQAAPGIAQQDRDLLIDPGRRERPLGQDPGGRSLEHEGGQRDEIHPQIQQLAPPPASF